MADDNCRPESRGKVMATESKSYSVMLIKKHQHGDDANPLESLQACQERSLRSLGAVNNIKDIKEEIGGEDERKLL